jgi:hypothetical protein
MPYRTAVCVHCDQPIRRVVAVNGRPSGPWKHTNNSAVCFPRYTDPVAAKKKRATPRRS